MALDPTRKATQQVTDGVEKTIQFAKDAQINPDAFLICLMLKFLIAQLGVLTITLAEKK